MKEQINFETLSAKETCSALKTDISNGLSEQEAADRLEKYGQNKLT